MKTAETENIVKNSIQQILGIRGIIKDMSGKPIEKKHQLAMYIHNFLYEYQHELFDEISKKQEYVTTQLSNFKAKGGKSWKRQIFEEANEGINNLDSLIRYPVAKIIVKKLLEPEIQELKIEITELKSAVDKAKEGKPEDHNSKKRPASEAEDPSASTVKKRKVLFDVPD